MNRSVGGFLNSPIIAKNLRAIRPNPHSRWHLDEMVVSIAGRQMYMWRAVDSEGEVLEILVQPQRDKTAALRAGAGGFEPPHGGIKSLRYLPKIKDLAALTNVYSAIKDQRLTCDLSIRTDDEIIAGL
jgi:hypothetical protein